MEFPERKAVISGVGISDIGRRLPTTALDLTVAACTEAVADAGLTAADIDAVLTLGDVPDEQTAAALGIEPRVELKIVGNAGLLTPVQAAAVAVGEGRARHVLVYRTVQMMGGTVAPAPDRKPGDNKPGDNKPGDNKPGDKKPGDKTSGGKTGRKRPPTTFVDMPYLLAANAFSAANWISMMCRRHMHEYGTTREALGAIAVNARRNAALNPLAVFRDEITMDDYMSARRISEPFGLLDCDVPVDGSVALIISTDAHADSAPAPIRIEAIGGSAGTGGWTQRPDYPRMAAHDAARELWSRTDLRPADVDLAQLYDGFTFLTLAWVEALGFCAEGESGSFVAGGTNIARDGILPLNTYGGQLSGGRMHGYWVLHEAVTQLRGRGDARQVSGSPEVAAVSAGGGPIAGALLLTR